MILVKDHLLIDDDSSNSAAYEPTENSWPNLRPMYLVVHYTANTRLEAVIRHFKTRYQQGNASAHLIIDRDGKTVQMVKFNRKAWHAGESKWGEIRNLNHFSIGIELVNAGKLLKTQNGAWMTWYGSTIDSSEVVEMPHRNDPHQQVCGWQAYTPAQIQRLIDVSNALHDKYGFLDVLGHDEIAPGRKVDPGPAFNMNSFRALVMGR